MKKLKSGKTMLIVENNPYAEPIGKFLDELKNTNWDFPYLPQIIHSIVICLILLILFFLYLTVGIISQISSTFWNLIVQTGEKIDLNKPIESSAYAIAIGVYFILFLPFFLFQFPFWLLGWFVSKIGFKTFVVLMFIITTILLLFYFSPSLSTKFKSLLNFEDSLSTDDTIIDSTHIKIEENTPIKKRK